MVAEGGRRSEGRSPEEVDVDAGRTFGQPVTGTVGCGRSPRLQARGSYTPEGPAASRLESRRVRRAVKSGHARTASRRHPTPKRQGLLSTEVLPLPSPSRLCPQKGKKGVAIFGNAPAWRSRGMLAHL